MDDVAGIWRFVRSVRAQERPRLLFFTCVAALVALGQTLGLAGAEALFLTRYGIEYLPQTFVFASVVSILGILLYAALVGSIRNDKMFSAMLWMASAPLATAAYLASRGFEWVLPALMAGYFVTQAIFLNHFWTFARDYFDTLATKSAGELFLLLEGQTRAVSDYGKRHEVTLNAQDAPNYFGEMAILDDRPRSATVVVTAEARLLSLSGESFQDLMLQMPEISFEICRTLSSRVRGLEAEHRKTERAMHVQ